MDVCYIVKRFPRLSQTFVLDEVRELERRGLNIRVVALKPPTGESLPEEYGHLRAKVHYLDPEYRTMEAQAEILAPLLEDWRIDHIHAHFATSAAALATLVGKRTGIPTSFTAHAHDIFHQRVDPATLAARIADAHFVVTVSNYNKRYLDTLLRTHGQVGSVVRLYNGVDLHQLRQLASTSVAREPDLIVGVGRLVAKKGFTHLIEACRILHARGRSVRCMILGDGEERQALSEQVARAGLGDVVQLIGARPRADVVELIRRGAAFVLPCVVDAEGDRDGLPTVLLESMALGTPVISTTIAGIPEIVDHLSTGLLVPERDPAALADAIDGLLASPALQQKLRNAALVRVQQRFNLSHNVGLLASHFEKCRQSRHVRV